MNDADYGSLASMPREQRWRNQAYPTPIVVALIKRQLRRSSGSQSEEHFLLIHRNQNPYMGKWALVGGKWDFGETLENAIIREVKEETDLDAVFVAMRGLVSERVMTGQAEQHGAHFQILVCELLADKGLAQEQEEGAVGWFTMAQIEALHEAEAIIPTDHAMICSFAGTPEVIPYVEAEMIAPIEHGSGETLRLERFERIEGLKRLRSGDQPQQGFERA